MRVGPWRLSTEELMAFELWCWRRLFRLPWTARRSKQSILKEINPDSLLEGLMLKLKLEYFGHLIRRANSLEKILMLGKTEDRGRRRGQDEMVGWHHQLNGHGFEQASGDSEGQGSLPCCRPCVAKVRHKWATEQVILNFNSQSMFSAMFYYLSKPC